MAVKGLIAVKTLFDRSRIEKKASIVMEELLNELTVDLEKTKDVITNWIGKVNSIINSVSDAWVRDNACNYNK